MVTVCELLDYLVMHCVAECAHRNKSDVSSNTGETDLHINTVTAIDDVVKKPCHIEGYGY